MLQRSVVLFFAVRQMDLCAVLVAPVAQADAVTGSLGFKFLARTEGNSLFLPFFCSIPGRTSERSFSSIPHVLGHSCRVQTFSGSTTMSLEWFGCVFLCQLYP